MDGIHHIALRVRDCDIAARFYASSVGLHEMRRITADSGGLRAVWMRAGTTVLMLEQSIRGRGQESGSGHVLVFPVDDLATAERRLGASGVPIADRTAATVYFEDPDGHRVGLSTYRFEFGAS
ncbi:MAG: VOC family protein [Vicinamibacteria bacterium]